jgi:hypothetical protein
MKKTSVLHCVQHDVGDEDGQEEGREVTGVTQDEDPIAGQAPVGSIHDLQ